MGGLRILHVSFPFKLGHKVGLHILHKCIQYSKMSGLVTEMIQATGEIGTQWILDLCNGIVKEGSIPEDWKSNLQSQRRPYGVWILQRDQIVGTCYESRRKDF